MRRGASHPSDGRPSRQRRRDERDDDSRSSRKRSDASSLLRRCWRVVQRRQCYVALLLGSVIANVVQLVWFFASRPGNGGQRSSLLLKERARSSYRKLLGAISSLGPSVAPSARGFAGAATGGSSAHSEIGGSRSGSAPAAVAPSLPAVPPPPSPPPLPLPVRHPKYRIAFTVPWIGKTFPSWFPYFLSSCRRSTFLADWLIFHEGAKLPDPQEVPPNVIFHDVGRDGLGRLFGTRLAEALGIYESEMQQKMVGLFQVAFREFAYIVTEYKPCTMLQIRQIRNFATLYRAVRAAPEGRKSVRVAYGVRGRSMSESCLGRMAVADASPTATCPLATFRCSTSG